MSDGDHEATARELLYEVCFPYLEPWQIDLRVEGVASTLAAAESRALERAARALERRAQELSAGGEAMSPPDFYAITSYEAGECAKVIRALAKPAPSEPDEDSFRIDMVHQLREALGWPRVALNMTPQAAWEQALRRVRRDAKPDPAAEAREAFMDAASGYVLARRHGDSVTHAHWWQRLQDAFDAKLATEKGADDA